MTIKCPYCEFQNPEDTLFCGKCGKKFAVSEKAELTKTLEHPRAGLSTGSLFANRYEIIEELGEGGMGKVFKALDTKIDEKIALKILKPEVASDKKTIERFTNELKLARKIRHENVCQMFDINEEDGIHYITMEYVPGEDLKSFIKRSKQLSFSKAVSLSIQICEGLAEAHKIGIIHRDLKPSNIMIDKKGTAHIMDFGIARSLESKAVTHVGVIIGTPDYMSPEQEEGKEVDQRTDIFSLGLIMHEMITGSLPGEIPRNPREINPQIPERLGDSILKCLEKKKKDRFPSAEEILSELRHISEPKPEKKSESKWINSIAVLPFRNMSADPENEYFSDGLSESIINTLTQIKDFKVVARTSAFSFKGTDADIREIGKKLNVEKVLEGSVQKAGDRLRITAQLINVDDGYHLWSEKFDRSMDDVFAIQDEISIAIVDNLKLKLLKGEKNKITKRHTNNPYAYNDYLKGKYFYSLRTKEGLKKSIENFESAIEKDPEFVLPYAGLSLTYLSFGFYELMPQKRAVSKAKRAILQALEIDEKVGEPHVSMACIKSWGEHDWTGAEQEYKRALELSPSDFEAHHMYGHFLEMLGRFDEAFSELSLALDLEPISIVLNNCLGEHFFWSKRYDEAIEQLKRTI
jgi:serine/threonine-protein kinase